MQHIDFRPLIYLAVDEFQPGELSPAGVGNATGGINGTPAPGTGGTQDTTTWGLSTGGITGTGRGLSAATGGLNDGGTLWPEYGRDHWRCHYGRHQRRKRTKISLCNRVSSQMWLPTKA